MECIIHYFVWKSYSKLKPLSSINEEAILKAKAIRQSIGGQNHHHQQCNSIPTPIDKEKHQLHRECCMKFTPVNSKNPMEKSQMRKSSRSPAGRLSKLKNSLLLLVSGGLPCRKLPHGKSLLVKIPSRKFPLIKFPHGEFPWGKLPHGKTPPYPFLELFLLKKCCSS